jgi:hypothetical protein
MYGLIYLSIRAGIPQQAVGKIYLLEPQQALTNAPPNPGVDAQPTGNEPIVIDQRPVVRIDQVQHRIIGTALL